MRAAASCEARVYERDDGPYIHIRWASDPAAEDGATPDAVLAAVAARLYYLAGDDPSPDLSDACAALDETIRAYWRHQAEERSRGQHQPGGPAGAEPP